MGAALICASSSGGNNEVRAAVRAGAGFHLLTGTGTEREGGERGGEGGGGREGETLAFDRKTGEKKYISNFWLEILNSLAKLTPFNST